MANTTAFARWLRERRAEVRPKLTQRALAQEAGVSSYYVNRLEANGTPQCTAPIDEPGLEKVDALALVLGRYLDRPLVNEARRVLGYPELEHEPEPLQPTPRLADGLPPDDRDDLALWVMRLPQETRNRLRTYILELDRLGVMQPFA